MKTVKGYKASDNMVCRDYKYKVGKTHEQPEPPILCNRGFHFCRNAKDVLGYYGLNDKFVLMEVEAVGAVVEEGDKCATDKLKVIRRLSKAETMKVLNQQRGTIAELFQVLKLPQNYKDLALIRFVEGVRKRRHISNYNSTTKKYFLTASISETESAIYNCFLWSLTLEGHAFWKEVHYHLFDKGKLPKIPTASLKQIAEYRKNKQNKKKAI